MTNVASLELCKELYKLSGWDDTYFLYTKTGKISTVASMFSGQPLPAYDAGFLLRKLPKTLTFPAEPVEYGLLMNLSGMPVSIGYTYAGYKVFAVADTPENATCKLAIELFRQGFLKKEGQS